MDFPNKGKSPLLCLLDGFIYIIHDLRTDFHLDVPHNTAYKKLILGLDPKI